MHKNYLLKIAQIEECTELLGPYRRFVFWVHGCCFDCPGCIAENTKKGPYIEININDLAEQIIESPTEGITISGGEPFLQAESVSELIKLIKKQKDIGVIIYSGFKIEEIKKKEQMADLLNYTDILIDGQYIKELDDERPFIGSANQRLHYITERYKKIGEIYYNTSCRRAEIKFTENQVAIIGVPTKNVFNIWQDIIRKWGNRNERD